MSSAGRASRAGAASRAAPTPSTQQPPLQPPPNGLGTSASCSTLDELFLNPLLWRAAGLRGPIKLQALRHDPSLQPFKFEARVGWFPGEAHSVTIPPPQPASGKDRHGHGEPLGRDTSSKYNGYGSVYDPAGAGSRDASSRPHHADHSAAPRERQSTQHMPSFELPAAASLPTHVTLAPPPPPISNPRSQPHQFSSSGIAIAVPPAQGPLDNLQGSQQGLTAASRDTSFPAFLRHVRRRSRTAPRLKCSSTKLRARSTWLLQDRTATVASNGGPTTSNEQQQQQQPSPQYVAGGHLTTITATTTSQLLANTSPTPPAATALLDFASLLQQAQALVSAPPPPQLHVQSEPGSATAITSTAQPSNPSANSMEVHTQSHADAQTPMVMATVVPTSNVTACPPLQPSIGLCEMVQMQCTPRPSDSGGSRGSLPLKTQPSVQAAMCPPTSSDTSSQHGFAAPGLSASGSVDSQLDLLHPHTTAKGAGRGAKVVTAHSPNSPLSMHEDVDMTVAE